MQSLGFGESVRWDVFLAHAGPDADIAQELHDLLMARGVSVCFDRSVLRPGDDWHALLPDYVRQSGMVVALVSEATQKAHYERSEIVLAVNLVRREGRRLVPVRLHADVEMPYGTEQLHALDAFGEAGLVRTAETIVDLVRNPDRLPPLKPTQVWCDRIPLASRWFTGRDEIVRQLCGEAHEDGVAARTYTISGMGGVGKTTVAAAVAEANRHELDVVWWVRAEEEATIIADLSELAPLVGLALGDAGMAEIARRVRRWLEQTDRSWLLVFDNAVSEESLEPWRPKRGLGTVLITSRSRNFDRIGSVAELRVLEPEAAEDFLRFRVRARNPAAADEPEARTVAERLEGLPLALEQAANWVARAPTRRFSRYLELLDDASKEPFPDGTRPLGYDATAVTTWRVSIEAAAVDAPLAAKLMQVLGFFAPDALPLEWLADKAVVQDPLLKCTADQVTDALVALHDYSLVQLGSDTLRIHRVIQQAARRMSDTGVALLAIRIARTQLDGFYGRPSDAQSSVARSIAVHIAAVCSHIHKSFPDLARNDQEVRGFLDSVVMWSDQLRLMSRYFEALLPAGSVFVIRSELDELDQTCTLRAGRVAVAAMEGLGMVSQAKALRNRLDNIDLARPDMEEPMRRASSVHFGPDKIEAFNSQAEQLLRDGKHDDALALKLSVLSATGWYYGHESQKTGEVFMDLARFCVEMEKIEAAVHYASQGFELLQRHLDHQDPLFGLTLMNLSGVQHAAGKADEARKSVEEALRILTTRLVQPHSIVGAAYGQLSLILESIGDYEGASAASQKAIDTLVAVHGEEHTDVAKSLANWALVLRKLEKGQEAIAAAQRAVDLYRNAYSDDHWETKWACRILETVSRR